MISMRISFGSSRIGGHAASLLFRWGRSSLKDISHRTQFIMGRSGSFRGYMRKRVLALVYTV